MHLRELDTNLIVVLDALLIDASVTKAAERLGRSPSAISHSLANMREIFGDPLFVRAGQRLVPTARAEELAPTVHIIVSGIENLLRPTAPFDPGTQERRFVVACSENFELGLLRQLRHSLSEIAPNISITRRPIDRQNDVEELRLGKTQFLLLQGEPGDQSADIVWEKLNEEIYVTLARRAHPLAGKRPTKAQFAAQQHMQVAQTDGLPDPVLSYFAQHGIVPADVVSASSAFVALFLAIDSNALVTVPQSVADIAASRQDIVLIEQPFPELSVANHLGWHRSQDRDECHEWLREQILSYPQKDKD